MKLLITGANGFLGRHVVAEAVRRGHGVRAMVRSADDAARHGWGEGSGVEVVTADLRRRKGLTQAAAGVDAVLHLAASKSGDLYAQYGGTVVATENLLWAMQEAGVRRIVQISSFSVYDYRRLRSFSVLDEQSPVEKDAFERDEYAHTKLVQERLVRVAADEGKVDATILRPGVIWGRDHLWTARIGVSAGRIWLRIGAWGRLPLTYVENCAEAIVLAAEGDAAIGATINIVDDETPRTGRYARMAARSASPSPIVLPVAWSLMRGLAGMATLTNRLLLGGKAKAPGIFVPARLHARFKPLRFDNALAKQLLDWTPRYGLDEAMNRATRVHTVDGDSAAAAPAARASGPAPAVKGAA